MPVVAVEMYSVPKVSVQSFVQGVRANWVYLAIYLILIFIVILILAIVLLQNNKNKGVFILMSFFVLLPAVILLYWRYRSSSNPVVMTLLEIQPAPSPVMLSSGYAGAQVKIDTGMGSASTGVGALPVGTVAGGTGVTPVLGQARVGGDAGVADDAAYCSDEEF